MDTTVRLEIYKEKCMDIQILKQKKKELNFTFEELSQKSGVPIQTLHNIFRGYTVNPRIDTMKAIEKALGIGQTGIPEEDRIAGSEDTTTISVSSAIYEWVELGENILEEKGEEFFESLKKVLCEVVKNR